MAKKRSKKEPDDTDEGDGLPALDNHDGVIQLRPKAGEAPGKIEFMEDVALDLAHWQDIELAEWLKLIRESPEAEKAGYRDDCPPVPNAREEPKQFQINGVTFKFRPSLPNNALPRTPEKLAVLRERCARKIPLFLRKDAKPPEGWIEPWKDPNDPVPTGLEKLVRSLKVETPADE